MRFNKSIIAGILSVFVSAAVSMNFNSKIVEADSNINVQKYTLSDNKKSSYGQLTYVAEITPKDVSEGCTNNVYAITQNVSSKNSKFFSLYDWSLDGTCTTTTVSYGKTDITFSCSTSYDNDIYIGAGRSIYKLRWSGIEEYAKLNTDYKGNINIKDITADKDGNLYALTDTELYKVNINKGSELVDFSALNKKLSLTCNSIQKLINDKDGNVYIVAKFVNEAGEYSEKLIKMNDTKDMEDVTPIQDECVFSGAFSDDDNTLECVLKDPNSNDYKVYKIINDKLEIDNDFNEQDSNFNKSYTSIMAKKVTAAGNCIVMVQGSMHYGNELYVKKADDAKYSLYPSTDIYDNIAKDCNGDVYVGSYSGVYIFK